MKLLLYCTKAKPYLVRNESDKYWYTMQQFQLDTFKNAKTYNGKIVAECDFEVEEITIFTDYTGWNEMYETKKVDYINLLMKSCLDDKQLDDYLYGENGYAIHIKNLHIFDEPKELSEYDYYQKYNRLEPITKAPQNMMRAYSSENMDENYILISIKPEWLCKILNCEKTIEVRKKVLKEMLK